MRLNLSKILMIFGAVFAVIGVGLLIAAVATGISARNFQAGAEKATGKIVSVDSRQSCSTQERNGRRVRDCHRVYAPTVVFTTADGKKITFESKVATSDQQRIGESVDVLYQPDDPQNARIAGSGNWIVPLVLGAIGLPFAVVGIILLAVQLRKRRRSALLETSGRRVQGQIQGVDRNANLRINNVNPWRIHVGWHDPASGASYTFVSENLLSDPTPALAGAQTIDVLIDPDNPQKRYRVDLASYGLEPV